MEVNWQDADSSSAKGFRYSFSNEQESKIMLCGGHVGSAHGKKLQDLQTKSSFSKGFIGIHKKDYPEMEKLKCCCSGKKHTYVATRNKPACGCLSPGFIQSAKCNHYCALVHAGKDPKHTEKQCFAWESIIRGIFMSGRVGLVHFTLQKSVAVEVVNVMWRDFMRN